MHRGTEREPGLVLGLDRGGTCRGVAFRVAPRDWDGVVAYLRAREQVTSVYRERVRWAFMHRVIESGADSLVVYLAPESPGASLGREPDGRYMERWVRGAQALELARLPGAVLAREQQSIVGAVRKHVQESHGSHAA